ncbi:DUF4419 domain-containing protein [Actinomadura geliboluensis]|uniref:DUF4419 domain-containing protein n=1 Tax=Actinomadura geliboluensis TaxID=882440 RepID=UPI0036CBC65A
MVTFRVDDVMPAAEPLPTLPLGDQFADAVVVGGDPSVRVLESNGVHPLLSAVGRAFAEHRPLVLSPDAVWLTIMQGLAQHVRLRSEELRPRLVGHLGRKRLTAVLDGPMPQDADSWQDAVESLSKILRSETDNTDEFDCDFSTSTDVERMAGRVVLLDAYSPYFAVWMICVCGIPSITLTGTVEDWQKIRDRVDTIATYDLGTWCRSLAAIADQCVRTAKGEVNTEFWRRIYNPIDAYGGEVITGWVARLYPYLTGGGEATEPNPLLELTIDEPRNATTDPSGFYRGPGIRSDRVPATLSRVRVNVNDRAGRVNRAMALHAGLTSVAQDRDGALRPLGGWYLAPATVEIDDVIDRIVRDHATEPPQPHRWYHASAELAALYRRIGSATMFEGAWRLRLAAAHRSILRGAGQCPIETVIDLSDGRSISAAIDFDTQTLYWIACRIEQADTKPQDPPNHRSKLVDDPADVPVYGTSLALLLDAALDSGGDISHLEIGRLDQFEGPAT